MKPHQLAQIEKYATQLEELDNLKTAVSATKHSIRMSLLTAVYYFGGSEALKETRYIHERLSGESRSGDQRDTSRDLGLTEDSPVGSSALGSEPGDAVQLAERNDEAPAARDAEPSGQGSGASVEAPQE